MGFGQLLDVVGAAAQWIVVKLGVFCAILVSVIVGLLCSVVCAKPL